MIPPRQVSSRPPAVTSRTIIVQAWPIRPQPRRWLLHARRTCPTLRAVAELAQILFLLAVVAAVTLFAARIGVPYPIPMVVAGLFVGLLPGVKGFEIEPDLVLALFLPPILFSAAFFLSPRELWRNVRPISLLAVGLVFTTTLAVAVVVMALAPQLGWPVAIALGAIVSPPDAIAATSIARQLNLPRRLVIIFEGESLVNDATALTIYRLAIAAVGVTGAFSFGEAAVSFVFVAAGGAIVGLVVGWVASWLLSLLEDPPVEVLISLIVPFAAYLPAEQLGVSGVLATVAAGLLVGFRAPRIMRSDTRLLGTGTWKMVIFVVNGLAFLLIGLQLPTVIADLEGYDAGELIGLAAAVSLTVILVRLAWVYPGHVPSALARSRRLLGATRRHRPASSSSSAGAACVERSPSSRPWRCRRRSRANPSPAAASSSSSPSRSSSSP